MYDALLLIAFFAFGLLTIISIASFIKMVRDGPKGIWLAQHMRKHKCPTPTLCHDSNECVMLCHEKRSHKE